ncbi:MAG: site-specific integrase [Proteobacteria bacterium]|nr:site-specific integrase [Pseudomonadota bacterium]
MDASEIKAFWRGLDRATMHESIKLGLRLQLVTGTRIGEVAGARHECFNAAEKIWVVPASQSKNKKDNRLPLSPLAFSIYEEMVALSDGSPLLMPSPHSAGVSPDKQQPIAPRSIAHALKDNLDKIGVANVRTHDLRRTCSSGLASLGVTKNIRERVLNHTMDKLDRSYDQHFYDDEKRAALERWAARIEAILASDTENVAVLTRELA